MWKGFKGKSQKDFAGIVQGLFEYELLEGAFLKEVSLGSWVKRISAMRKVLTLPTSPQDEGWILIHFPDRKPKALNRTKEQAILIYFHKILRKLLID